MNTGEKVRVARKGRGMSQEELARELGVNPVTISYWEKGKREIKLTMLEKIAKALRFPLRYFFEDDLAYAKTKMTLDEPKGERHRIPIVSSLKLGRNYFEEPALADEIVEYSTVTKDEIRGYNVEDIVFAIAHGDSMAPYVQEGDRLLIVRTDIAYEGDLVLALIPDSDEVTLKWFAVKDGDYFLVPENRAKYNIIPMREREFKVLAKVLRIHRIVNFPKRNEIRI